jgi:hypothetical protein
MSLTTGVRVFVSRVLDVVLRRRRDDRLAEALGAQPRDVVMS